MTPHTVIPLFETNDLKHLVKSIALELSSPDVGSSKNKICGFLISSIPILTRLRSPPEIPAYIICHVMAYAARNEVLFLVTDLQ